MLYPISGTVALPKVFSRMAVAVAISQICLAVLGAALAVAPCIEQPHFHRVLHILYCLGAIFIWVLLAVVGMYCIAFDFEARAAVRKYWNCPQSSIELEGTGWGNFESTVALCASGAFSAVLGLFAACHFVGWQSALRIGVMLFSGGGASFGLLTLGMGLMLTADDVLNYQIDLGICTAGALVLVFSVLGFIAAQRQLLFFLKVYAIGQALCVISLVSLLTVIFLNGFESANSQIESLPVMDDGQQGSREHSTNVNTVNLLLLETLNKNRLASLVIFVLILCYSVMNMSMAASLRWLLL